MSQKHSSRSADQQGKHTPWTRWLALLGYKALAMGWIDNISASRLIGVKGGRGGEELLLLLLLCVEVWEWIRIFLFARTARRVQILFWSSPQSWVGSSQFFSDGYRLLLGSFIYLLDLPYQPAIQPPNDEGSLFRCSCSDCLRRLVAEDEWDQGAPPLSFVLPMIRSRLAVTLLHSCIGRRFGCRLNVIARHNGLIHLSHLNCSIGSRRQRLLQIIVI